MATKCKNKKVTYNHDACFIVIFDPEKKDTICIQNLNLPSVFVLFRQEQRSHNGGGRKRWKSDGPINCIWRIPQWNFAENTELFGNTGCDQMFSDI